MKLTLKTSAVISTCARLQEPDIRRFCLWIPTDYSETA